MEFTGFPESLTKDHQMYHGNKSIAPEIFDPTPSSFPTIQPVATVIDFSAIINSQASISRAKTFGEFSAEIINCIERIFVNCSRVDIVCDSYFDNSLHIQEIVVVLDNTFHSQPQLQYRKIL